MKRVGQVYREKLASTAKAGAQSSKNIFLVHYSRLTSLQISDLRKNLRQAGAGVYATKNTIARRVLKDLNQQQLADAVKDQSAFVWTDGDGAAVSKILKKFATDHDVFALGGGVVEGRYVTGTDIKKLAELPSREVILAKLLSVIQAPASRLAGALNAKGRDVLSILKQKSEQK